jgi:hypothetical protein
MMVIESYRVSRTRTPVVVVQAAKPAMPTGTWYMQIIAADVLLVQYHAIAEASKYRASWSIVLIIIDSLTLIQQNVCTTLQNIVIISPEEYMSAAV